MASGAKGYPAGEVVERFTDMYSEVDLSTDSDVVMGTLHYSPEHRDETLKTVNAHLKDPTLDEKWFNRIRENFALEMSEHKSNISTQGFDALRWAIYGEQPLRRYLSMDVPNTVNNVSLKEVSTWVKRTLKRGQASIVIAGDLNATEAGDAVDELFKGLPAGEATSEFQAEADFTPKRLLLHTPKVKVSNLAFVGKLPLSKTAAEFEDILLTRALGSGTKSVLFDAVRTKLRASYNFGAFITTYAKDNRILILAGEVETSKIAEAETIIREAYAEFKQQGYSPDLELAKNSIRQSLVHKMEDTGSISYTVLQSRMMGQNTSRVLSMQEELDSITLDSLKQRLDSAFPAAEDLIVIATSPDAKALPDACVFSNPKQAADC
jgi:predicted Zn-dependent peptidase